MTKYFNISKNDNSFIQNLELAKRYGYTHIFMWINSDLSWTFFAKTLEEAENQAISLYMSEKKQNDREFATQYYSEYVDVYSIEEYIEIVEA